MEGRFQSLPLHAACSYGHLECVEKLLEWDHSDSTLEKGSVPIVLKAFSSTTETAKELSKEEKEKIVSTIEERERVEEDGKTESIYTPLTKACQFGHYEVVEFLLKKGAKPYPLALVKAIEGDYMKSAEKLLQSDKWKTLLRYAYVGNNELTTPFHELIKYMPSLAEYVLHKSVKLDRFLANSKNFEVEMEFEFVDQNFKVDIFHETTDTNPNSDTPVDKTKEFLKSGFNADNHPLSLMVMYERGNLLTHPVCAALLHEKLRKTAILNVPFFLLYICFLGAITALPFTLPSPDSCNTVKTQITIVSMIQNNVTSGSGAYATGLASFLIVLSSILLFSLTVRLLRHSWHYFRDEMNLCWKIVVAPVKMYLFLQKYYKDWITFTLLLLSSIFAGGVLNRSECFCTPGWQWQIGAVAIFLAYIELIILLTQFKFFGVFVLMFIRVLKSFLKLFLLAILLIVAFGLTFYLLLRQENLQGSPYFTTGNSLLKVFSMTVGDISSDDFFGFDIRGEATDDFHLSYYTLTTLLWVVSLIFMTILLSNLLIGLAVGDIQTIHRKANFEVLALQVKYVLADEYQSNLESKTVKPNCYNYESVREKMVKEIVFFIWGGVRYDSRESIAKLLPDKEADVQLEEMETP